MSRTGSMSGDSTSRHSEQELDVKLSCLLADRFEQRAFYREVNPESVSSFSMWNGFLCIQEDGGALWSHSIPRPLVQLLQSTKGSHIKPEYAVLGPSNYYFLRMSNEKIYYQGPVNFCETLEKWPQRKVKLVSFGLNQSWFILYEDGWCEWNDLPSKLYKTLNDNTYNLPELEYLSMGPKGQWFLRFENGNCRVFVQNKEILKELRDIDQNEGQVEVMAFGKYDSYCILHSYEVEEDHMMDVGHAGDIEEFEEKEHFIDMDVDESKGKGMLSL